MRNRSVIGILNDSLVCDAITVRILLCSDSPKQTLSRPLGGTAEDDLRCQPIDRPYFPNNFNKYLLRKSRIIN